MPLHKLKLQQVQLTDKSDLFLPLLLYFIIVLKNSNTEKKVYQ